MSSWLRRERVRLLPWLVLAGVLAMTAAVTVPRYRATTDASASALAESHERFVEEVSHQQAELGEAQREIALVLLAATDGDEDSLDPNHVASVLRRVDAHRLSGLVGYVLWSDGTFANLNNSGLANTPELDAGLQRAVQVPDSATMWGTSIRTARNDYLAVAGVASGGDIVVAVFDAPVLFAGDAGRLAGDFGVMVTRDPTRLNDVDPSAFVITASGQLVRYGNSVAMLNRRGQSAPSLVDLGGGVGRFDSNNMSTFVASQPVTVFGRSWTLIAISGDNFIELPSQTRQLFMAGLGGVLGLALCVLVRRLVSSNLTAQQELEFNAARFDVGFELSPIGVAELDSAGTIVLANDAMVSLFGIERTELVGCRLSDFVDDSGSNTNNSEHAHLTVVRSETHYVVGGGRELWVHQSTSTIAGPKGEQLTLVQMVDITEQLRIRAELERQALHDDLTGLPNRALLDDRLEHAIVRSRRSGRHTAALFIDIDLFKTVNDSLGHRVGDQLLIEVSRRLTAAARSGDTVARFGGDEFVVVCQELIDPADALTLARRFSAELAAPIQLADRAITITISVGIAVAAPGDNAEAVLRDADLAMYQAKGQGRDSLVLFDHDMLDQLVHELKQQDELRAAVAHDEFVVFYQPLIDTQSGAISSFEALVRWQHPTDGLIMPDDFLPVAGAIGLLPEIDAWVLRTAAHQLKNWATIYPEAALWSCAVNASAVNFADPGFARSVRDIVDEVGIQPSQITIEITEHAVLSNTDTANAIIGELRAAGIRVAIDDFGTGYSSFSLVASLSFDVLKIDRSLVQRLGDTSGTEIVSAIIQMAHSLGLATVAEGVETAQDMELLRALGSDEAQGYFIARPLSTTDLEAILSLGQISDRRPQSVQ
jgi:diguanylate cyclase (GGDEF)-like protein/PAS domain S-box-containing protein